MRSPLDEGYTLLYIDTDEDFTVKNAEGETLSYVDGVYSGTMDAAYARMIPMGTHVLRMIFVRDSQHFEFIVGGECQYLGNL